MALDPDLIDNKRFGTSRKDGYNLKEVDDFLDQMAAEVREHLREDAELVAHNEKLEEHVKEVHAHYEAQFTAIAERLAQADQLALEHNQLTEAHDALKVEHDNLVTAHGALEAAHADLQAEHTALLSREQELLDRIAELENREPEAVERSIEIPPAEDLPVEDAQQFVEPEVNPAAPATVADGVSAAERLLIAAQEVAEQLQREAEETVDEAKTRAATIREEAEAQAEQIIRDAEASLGTLGDEIEELKRNRDEIRATLRAYFTEQLEALEDRTGGDA